MKLHATSNNLFLYAYREIADNTAVIKKVVKKYNLHDDVSRQADLNHWRSRSCAERIEAVEFLRKQYYGNSKRLQRVARVIQRSQS